MTTSELSMTLLMSSPRSILPVTCRSGKRAAQSINAWPMRPFAPVMITRVISLQNAALLQRCAHQVSIFCFQFYERQSQFVLHHIHHFKRRFNWTRIRLDKQIAKQREKARMNFQRGGGTAFGERAYHVGDFAGNDI